MSGVSPNANLVSLPRDTIQLLLYYLSAEEICHLGATCKSLYAAWYVFEKELLLIYQSTSHISR
jgi:hypothetical protein